MQRSPQSTKYTDKAVNLTSVPYHSLVRNSQRSMHRKSKSLYSINNSNSVKYTPYPSHYHLDSIGIRKLQFNDYHQMQDTLKNVSSIARGGYTKGMTMTEFYNSYKKRKKRNEEAYNMFIATHSQNTPQKISKRQDSKWKQEERLNTLEKEYLDSKSRSAHKGKLYEEKQNIPNTSAFMPPQSFKKIFKVGKVKRTVSELPKFGKNELKFVQSMQEFHKVCSQTPIGDSLPVPRNKRKSVRQTMKKHFKIKNNKENLAKSHQKAMLLGMKKKSRRNKPGSLQYSLQNLNKFSKSGEFSRLRSQEKSKSDSNSIQVVVYDDNIKSKHSTVKHDRFCRPQLTDKNWTFTKFVREIRESLCVNPKFKFLYTPYGKSIKKLSHMKKYDEVLILMSRDDFEGIREGQLMFSAQMKQPNSPNSTKILTFINQISPANPSTKSQHQSLSPYEKHIQAIQKTKRENYYNFLKVQSILDDHFKLLNSSQLHHLYTNAKSKNSLKKMKKSQFSWSKMGDQIKKCILEREHMKLKIPVSKSEGFSLFDQNQQVVEEYRRRKKEESSFLGGGSAMKAKERMILQKNYFSHPERRGKQLSSLERYLENPYPITNPEKVEINEIFEELYTIDILGLDKASTGAEKVDSNDYFLRLKEILYNDGISFNPNPADDKNRNSEEVVSRKERQQILSEYLDIVLNDYFTKEREIYKKSVQRNSRRLDKMLRARNKRSKFTQTEKVESTSYKNYIAQNISNVLSFQTILKKSSEQVGCLITKNMPKLMHANSFTRGELFEFFTVFKVLCDITSQKLKMDKEEQKIGISEKIWSKGVVRLNLLGDFLVKKIYYMLDVKEEGFIDWEEFVKCMQIINTRTFKDKIDLFVNISDDNGNGKLDKDEVSQYCKIILKKFMRKVNESFLEDMTDFFTRFIFQTCGFSLEEEIPATLIRQLIVNKHPDAHLLCMFCSVDPR